MLDHNMIITDSEEFIGPELMKFAKIIKGRCDHCSIVFLAKVFNIDELINEA